MNTEDKQEFADIMRRLMKIYGEECDKEILSIWWVALEDLPIEAVRGAANDYVRTEHFAPKPADIRERGRPKSGFPTPEMAWARVPKSEYEAGYVCNEMLAAVSAVQDAIDRGDLIAARADFKRIYAEKIEIAESRGDRPQFFYTGVPGLVHEDQMREREQAMLTARQDGWISDDKQLRHDKYKQMN